MNDLVQMLFLRLRQEDGGIRKFRARYYLQMRKLGFGPEIARLAAEQAIATLAV